MKHPLVLCAALLLPLAAALQDPDEGPELRRVSLDHLATLAGTRGTCDLQLKATWCGAQTKSIPTVVIGTAGRRLHAEVYEGIRQPGWHYGNDDPSTILYYQLGKDAWRGLLDDLIEAGWDERVNPEVAEPEEAYHVIFSWTGFLEGEVRYAELFLDHDTPELRKLVLRSVPEAHPGREVLAHRLFFGI